LETVRHTEIQIKGLLIGCRCFDEVSRVRAASNVRFHQSCPLLARKFGNAAPAANGSTIGKLAAGAHRRPPSGVRLANGATLAIGQRTS
jgi:hypothetical protein